MTRVKAQAVQQVEGKDVIFTPKIVKTGFEFEPVTVQLGQRSKDGQWVEVVKGINPSQRYIAEGSFLLKSELEKERLSMDINKPELPKPEGLFDRVIQFAIQNAIWVMLLFWRGLVLAFGVIKNSLLMPFQILPIPKSRLILKPMGIPL